MAPVIIMSGSSLKIGAFVCAGVGDVPEQTIDLDGYAGEHVHVWLDADGNYSLDRNKNHYWHVAELDVPARQYQDEDTGDVDGQPIVRPAPLPLDLSQTAIVRYDLPPV